MTVKGRHNFLIIYCLLVFLVMLRIFAYIFPEARFWGINHLNFLPEYYLYIYIPLALAVLMIPLLKIFKPVSAFLVERFNTYLYDHHEALKIRLLFVFLSGLIFGLCLMPTHFLGDGYSWLDYFSGDRQLIFKWSEPGAILFVFLIQSLLGDAGSASALLAYRIIAILSGMISIYFYFLITARLTDDKIRRFIGFISLFFSGSLLLFFGYVEHYSILWPVITIYLYLGLTCVKDKRFLGFVFLTLLIGIFLHFLLLILVPASLYLLISSGLGRKFYSRYRIFLITTLLIVATVIIYFFYVKLNNDLYFRNIFLPALAGKPIAPDYYIFSAAHLMDIFNQMLLISPLFIFLFFLAVKRIGRVFSNKQLSFLTLISIGSVLFLFIIDPKLSLPRDFDLFSLSFIGPALLFVYLLNDRNLKALKEYCLPVLLYLVLAVVPFLLVNLRTSESIAYINYIIDLDREKSASAITTLKDYYEEAGDTAAAAELNELFASYHPDLVRLRQAGKAVTGGDIETAQKLLARIKPDVYSYNYHTVKGLLYHQQGNLHMARDEFLAALQLNRYNPVIHRCYGAVQQDLRLYRPALISFQTAYRLDSTSVVTLERLPEAHLLLDQLDSAYYYARKLTADPYNRSSGYYFISVVLIKAGKRNQAEQYFRTYLNLGRDDPYYQSRIKELAPYFEKD